MELERHFVSDYQGCSDYRLPGLPGRVSLHYLSAQHCYPQTEPQLVGTVVNGPNPVPEDLLQAFRDHMKSYAELLPEVKARWVFGLVTAKWYPALGWVRCEPVTA